MPITKSFAGLSMFGLGMFPAGDYESIATVTLANSTTSSVTFSNLSGYQHLQIRGLVRNTRGAFSTGSNLRLRMNGDTGSNYVSHRLYGDGSSTGGSYYSAGTSMIIVDSQSDLATSGTFTGFFIDILDYSSTSKNTTVRGLNGSETNSLGFLGVTSGLWLSTAAVTSITLLDTNYNFVQHSTFALYGIKTP